MSRLNSYLSKVPIIAVLSALGFVLDRFLSINTPATKINLAFIPAAFGAVLLGPVAGALIWGLTDLIGAILLPFGPYHPGFTICAALMGAIYGLFLHNNPININKQNKNGSIIIKISRKRVRFFPNIIIPVIINCLVLGLIINTLWVSMLYGSKTYLGWFLYRLIEYAILVPVQLAVLPALIVIAQKIKGWLFRS